MFACLARTTLCLALVIFTLSAAAHAEERDHLVAARAALSGKYLEGVEVFGHGFNIHAARITHSEGVTTISGNFSHRLRLRNDDEVYYHIKKQGDKVLDMRIQVVRGGITSYLGTAWAILSFNFAGGPVTEDTMLGKLAAKLDNSWEDAAELIVAAIAVKARAVGGDPGKYRPDPRPGTGPLGTSRPLPTVPAAVLVGDGGKAKVEVQKNTK